jgi:hypothetical protein
VFLASGDRIVPLSSKSSTTKKAVPLELAARVDLEILPAITLAGSISDEVLGVACCVGLATV